MPWKNHWTPEARRKRDATRRQTGVLRASERARAIRIPNHVPDQEDDDWREFHARRARLDTSPSSPGSGTTSVLPISQFYRNPSKYAETKSTLSKYAAKVSRERSPTVPSSGIANDPLASIASESPVAGPARSSSFDTLRRHSSTNLSERPTTPTVPSCPDSQLLDGWEVSTDGPQGHNEKHTSLWPHDTSDHNSQNIRLNPVSYCDQAGEDDIFSSTLTPPSHAHKDLRLLELELFPDEAVRVIPTEDFENQSSCATEGTGTSEKPDFAQSMGGWDESNGV